MSSEGIKLAQIVMKHMARNHARRNYNGLKKWEAEIEHQAGEVLIEATADFACELYNHPCRGLCLHKHADTSFVRGWNEFLGEWCNDINVRACEKKVLLRIAFTLHYSVAQTRRLLERHGIEL